VGPPAAKTNRQKTATLQRPCLWYGSHVGWLSPTCSLWLRPHTDAHRSMHARPAARCALLAMLLLSRALSMLVCAMLRACVYSPWCGPRRSPASWGPAAPGDRLRLMKHLQHGGLATTYGMKHLKHMLTTYVCSHCKICNIQIKHLQHTPSFPKESIPRNFQAY
jgi:hypothetical protein